MQGAVGDLVIDSVMSQARACQRGLHTAFIDYQKAFDSVPHTWLIRVLEVYNIAPPVIAFLRTAMGGWRTSMCLHAGGNSVRTGIIPIKRGIFQGDSLSPL